MPNKIFLNVVSLTADAELTPHEIDYLTTNKHSPLVSELHHVFSKLKKHVPATLEKSANAEPFIIPSQEESLVDVAAEEKKRPSHDKKTFLGCFRGDDLHRIKVLYEKYPATHGWEFIPHELSKPVEWGAFLESLGNRNRLVKHTITPNQALALIEEAKRRDLSKRCEYLFFMEGLHDVPEKNETLGRDNWRAVHIISLTLYELPEDRHNHPDWRNFECRVIGDLYPVDPLGDDLDTMRAGSLWNSRTFDDCIVLLKG